MLSYEVFSGEQAAPRQERTENETVCVEGGGSGRGQYSLAWGLHSMNLSPAPKESVPRLFVSACLEAGQKGKREGLGLNAVTVKHQKNRIRLPPYYKLWEIDPILEMWKQDSVCVDHLSQQV